jgi:hypothetical protein
VYYQELDKDPDMHLHTSIENLTPNKVINCLLNWLKLIAFYTESTIDSFIKKKMLVPSNILVDKIIITDAITTFEMYTNKLSFPDDKKESIVLKANCYHYYALWIKTADILYIVNDIFRILYEMDEQETNKIHVSKKDLCNKYDTIHKIFNRYSSIVFHNQTFYIDKRKFLDSQIMEALEEDSHLFEKVTSDIVQFFNSIDNGNINELLQAKNSYLETVSGIISPLQEDQLEKSLLSVVYKIESIIKIEDDYDKVYQTVTDFFCDYSTQLIHYREIFSNLASAEYLFKHFSTNNITQSKFDYSCISILYYLALETFINALIYKPYYSNVLFNLPQDKWAKYVSSKTHFWNKNTNGFKATCELGNLGHLLKEATNRKELKKFITNSFKKSDIQKLSDLGQKIIVLTPRRNEAAHSNKIITYNDVLTDRKHVFNTLQGQDQGLIMELLHALYD